MSEQPSTPRSAVTAGIAIVAFIIMLVLFVVVTAAAALYGPAWSALEHRHGPFAAALILGAVTALPVGLWVSRNMARAVRAAHQ